MGLNINIEGVSTDFSNVKRHYYEGNITFELSSPDTGIGVLFPFPFPIDKKYIPFANTSKVFIFKNKHFKTNDLVEFRVDKKITKKEDEGLVGYFFSSQLLLEESGLETFEQAKYSIIYALTGIEVILKNEANTISLPPKTIDQEDINSDLNISHLYDEDVIILVVNQDLLKEPDKFDINQYLCHLYKYGFYLLIEHGIDINYNKLKIIKNNFDNARTQTPRKFINIKTSSSAIDFQTPKSYYKILLHQLITQKPEFITSFIMLYQVIELLKDDVLRNEMMTLKTYTTGYEIKQAVEELSKTLTLLRKLFGSSYSNLHPQIIDSLKGDLNTFLKKIYPPKPDKKESDTLENKINRENFANLLYQFRNTMVHNYSKVIQERVNDDLLNDILMRFEYLIIDLIHTYHYPST